MSDSKSSPEIARRPRRQPKRHAIDALTPEAKCQCGFSLCGIYTFGLEPDVSRVTCKNCLKRLARKP